MSRYLIVENISGEDRQYLGKLGDTDLVGVGRDPEGDGLKIENTAISRTHGYFLRHQRHWFYKDNGSTNGSWVNGKSVKAGQIRIVRSGDIVQLANTALQFREENESAGARRDQVEGIANVGGRSLLVFSRGEYLGEYPIREYGRALCIGGSSGDLELEGDLYEAPSLVVERKGSAVVADSLAQEACVFVNGQEIEDRVNLRDGDEVVISYYTILFNDPVEAASSQPRQEGDSQPGTFQSPEDNSQPNPGQSSLLRGWTNDEKGGEAPSKPIGRSASFNTFGQPDQLDESAIQTYAIDPENIGDPSQNLSYGGPRSGRTGAPEHDRENDFSYSSLEDRIILLVIFFVLVALMILVAVFALA